MALEWTVARLIESMRGFFASRHIATARLDAELLLAHVLAKPRIYLYTHHDQPVTDEERDALRGLAKRRAAHEPMAYILGEQEFYGLPLSVDSAVLIPRPETEQLVDVALAYLRLRNRAVQVLDIGTGSGAIAVALAHQLPAATVVAVDNSAAALTVAARNVERHGLGARVRLIQADMADIARCAAPQVSDAAPYDAVLSNPPYIGDDERHSLPPDVAEYEPHAALFANERGRTMLSQIVGAAPRLLAPQGLLAMEIGPRHAEWLRQAPAAEFTRRIDRDLAGHDRLLVAWRGPWPSPEQDGEAAVQPADAEASGSATQVVAPELARD